MSNPRVLSIGQCAYDHRSLTRELGRQFRAEVVGADTFEDALTALKAGRFGLVLINRVTDVDGSSGLELVRTMKGDSALEATPIMLVSDHPDAQSAARALGALPGFGKSALRDPKMLETVLGGVLGADDR
jgi:PleD family two-component response regulator